ncbi:uncharacterized protein EV422DRAFT_526154 [Fimicolochytrium jonesii]|uniref:uncharacterized protein n=1 Tax=Fimicolochytrium jonesii TaxID=1396493 RepID=UPI0022FE9FDB|nr:uncharacterized protein EV422DRAFT_526154 [Fimicolochytrium jonesii]KAI8822231.1 hypothetical protein EV422DRAFT_526154 [Fimicolochytrium jonesii]
MSGVITNPVQLGTKAHKIYVTRLYRRSLRLAQDWYWQRVEFRQKAVQIRQLFDEGKQLDNPKHVEALLGKTELILATYYHPQPYFSPAAPGGSKWERNIPFPEELIKRGVTIFDNN